MSVDIDKVISWTWYVVLTSFGVFMLAVFIYWICDNIKNSHAKDACRDRGGMVDHYSADHERYWRCTVPEVERAP